MKIIKLHIDNFGRLQNVNLDFSNGINQLFYENGWGKTTLSIFVKSMFYGMSASRDNIKNERKKYMPWQGGNFGGYLEFSCQKGAFRIVRSFGKTPEGDENQLIDCSTNRQLEIPKEGLGEWLFGVGKETFEMTAFFPQLNYFSGVNEQISAGVLGLEKLKFDLANVGQAMTKIKKEISFVKKQSIKQTEIDRLIKQLSQLKLDLAQAEQNLNNIDEEIKKTAALVDLSIKEVEREKISIDTQQKIFSSKLSIENEIKKKNEQLAQLLLAVNDKKEKRANKSLIFAILLVVSLVLMAGGIALGALHVSWLVGGIIAGLGILICIFAVILKTKNNLIASEGERQQEIKNCQNQIALLNENLQSFEGIGQPNRQTFEVKQANLFDLQLNLQRLEGERQSTMHHRAALANNIEELQDEITSSQEKQNAIEEKLSLLEKTNQFLLQAKENVSERFVGPINLQLKEFLQSFDMRGREYVIDTNFEIKESAESGLKAFEHSSQGYQDILSLAMRFLLIKMVFKGERPFVVLDDSFVNLDGQNFEKAQKIVNEFARDYQILYICCNSVNKLKEN